jgi:hypothetical protein
MLSNKNYWCHDTQYNRHNDAQHNDTQYLKKEKT